MANGSQQHTGNVLTAVTAPCRDPQLEQNCWKGPACTSSRQTFQASYNSKITFSILMHTKTNEVLVSYCHLSAWYNLSLPSPFQNKRSWQTLSSQQREFSSDTSKVRVSRICFLKGIARKTAKICTQVWKSLFMLGYFRTSGGILTSIRTWVNNAKYSKRLSLQQSAWWNKLVMNASPLISCIMPEEW